MGDLNCVNCKKEENTYNEIQSNFTSIDSSHEYNMQIFKPDLRFINKAKNKQNEFNDSYFDYSFALFQRFNLIRTEPLKFYSESDKYNLSYIIEELIDKNDKSLKLTWSTKKEKIINNIMTDKRLPAIRKKLNLIKRYFSKEFNIKIYYGKGNFSRIDDALWNILFGLKNSNEEKLKTFLTKKNDYCVIYSINEDDINFENDNKDKDRERNGIFSQNKSSGDIISFFILFYSNRNYS